MGLSRTMRRAPRLLASSMPMRGGTPPGRNRKTRGSSVSSGAAGQTARTMIPCGRFSFFKNPGSGDRMETALSLTKTKSSMACWRRSARLAAEFIKAATDRAPDERRILSSPASVLGKEMPTIKAMMTSTTIISISVTPATARALFPVDDVGIHTLAAGLAVGAETDDVGFIAVLARVFVNVRVFPRVDRDVLPQIRPQGFQALLLGRKHAVVGVKLQQRGLEIIDLHARRLNPRLVRLFEQIGPDQHGE